MNKQLRIWIPRHLSEGFEREWPLKSAFALEYKYNKKIGTNRRFKCIIYYKINQQWYLLIMKYIEYPSILSNVYLRVYMSYLLRFSPYVEFNCIR
jgi:hypothetical protein